MAPWSDSSSNRTGSNVRRLQIPTEFNHLKHQRPMARRHVGTYTRRFLHSYNFPASIWRVRANKI
eukprot:7031644-Pyramimonas_sp.AAC.1